MRTYFAALSGILLLCAPFGALANDTDALKAEIQTLREQMAAQQKSFEARIQQLEAQISKPQQPQQNRIAPNAPDTDLGAALDRVRQPAPEAPSLLSSVGGSSLGSVVQGLNPDVSVIVDTYFHSDDSKEGFQHIMGEIAGFGGHAHEGEDAHGHGGGLEDGFNLRHLELRLSAEIDPYFRGWAIAAIEEDGAEIEEAVIQTSNLPAGLQLQAGKFFSNFSRINAQHEHEWDFVDAPLAHELIFGDHGLNEKGAQLSWLAPTPFQLLLGVEALQGENEGNFTQIGGDRLPEDSGPRLWVGWAKIAPNLSEGHGLELGLAFGRGDHQEEHHETVGLLEVEEFLDGDTSFASADFVYKFDSGQDYGAGDWTVQSGYLWREKDLSIHDREPFDADDIGKTVRNEQDGYYLQATYGFLPRWRLGLRWEEIGLTNEFETPDESGDYGDSSRLSAMIDFAPSHFSRLRLQVANGDYMTEDGEEDAWQLFLQWTVALGAHGAHRF